MTGTSFRARLLLMTTPRNATLAGARFQASVRTSGLELPDCFAVATSASLERAKHLSRKADKRDARRLAAKAAKIGESK